MSKFKDRELTNRELTVLKTAIMQIVMFTPNNSQEKIIHDELKAVQEQLNNKEISNLSHLVSNSQYLVPALQKYNDRLLEWIRESYTEQEKDEYRPNLHCCNSLWRTLKDAFYELYGVSL